MSAIRAGSVFAFLVVLAGLAHGAAPSDTELRGMVERPCPPPLPMPASSRALLTDLFMRPRILGDADFSALMKDPDFAAYNGELQRRGARDWAGLCRYQADNAARQPGSAQVVFIGDSITENWLLADPQFFTGKLLNRGIGAQTSAQMLVRFSADVVALRPAAVHILAGTNDVAGNNGPLRPRDFQNNIEAMVEMARANGIRVILGSIPPSAAVGWQPTLRPAPRIRELNDWLRQYARRNGLQYIDYHAALRGSEGELRPALGNDGVHPNRDGYAIMRRLVEAAVAAVPAQAATVPAAQPARSATPAHIATGLMAGASRIDYTPRGSQLPANFTGVLDPIYVRSVVLDNGTTRAAMVAIDAGAMPTDLYRKVSARAAAELRIPANQLLMSASHTHSVPFRLDPAVEEVVMRSLREAVSRLQPARVSWGTGLSYINVNRDRVDPKTNRWWEGPNYEGTSDKTVAVVRIETPAGQPIAAYYNYAVHGVITGTLDMISGDIPGAASRYIEESLGGDAVALWSSSAAGDQNPIYFNQTYELRDIRIADYARRGEDISNAMPPGGQGMDRTNPRVQLLMEQQKRINESLGQMLGEEVLHVMRENLVPASGSAILRGAQASFSCPARKRTDQGRAGYEGKYVDDGEVSIGLGALRIGDVYVGAVDGEVYSAIAQRLKRESPFKNTLLATLTNGMAQTGYIPSEDAFGRNVFTVLSSRLKPGCAEAGIVDGLVELMRGL